MSRTKRTSEILFLVGIFAVLPAVFIFGVLLPTQSRSKELNTRLEQILARERELPNVQPLSSEERKILNDPEAPWKIRIPMVANDAERLAHYNAVVTELQRAWISRGVKLAGVRSTWDPIRGSYTLPSALGSVPQNFSSGYASDKGTLQGWVLEARLDGSPDQMFNALEALPGINPLLEPVGLRWESGADGQKQMIVLRNMVLAP